MKNNKKDSKRKARGALNKLHEEKYNKKNNEINKRKFANIKVNYKNKEIIVKQNNQLKILKSKFKEKIKKLKENLSKKSQSKKDLEDQIKKLETKQKEKINKLNISFVNKLNSSRKGEIFIENTLKDNIININNVIKTYATKSLLFNALDDVSVSIKRGEFVVILGPSGSGKTTLLNVLSGLDRATKGEVVVDGVNIQALTQNQLVDFRRNNIGFVFQSYNLLPSLDIKDNIEIGRSLQKDKEKRLEIDNLLKNMGISNQKNKRTYELSGGQQQRVAIARAIAKNPKILIGDEPTGALDSSSRVDVLKLFQKINKTNKTTIILVTHDKNIAQLANKIIYVKDSKIQEIKINKTPKPARWLKGVEKNETNK